MSTQDEPGIPLSILPEEKHQHFRLLELPPELLAILTTEKPEALRFKSTQGPLGEAGGTLVLCTPNKTYNVRQKNSSNTVYLLESNASNEDEISPEMRLQAISKPESTLETSHAAKTAAASYVRQLLPVLASTGRTAPTLDALTRKQLLANIPASDGECEAALRELAVFEDETTGHCILPSAQLKMQVWLAMLETARAEGFDILKPMDPEKVRLLLESSEDLPVVLPKAVLHAITSPDKVDTGEICLESARLVTFLGINRLEVDAPKHATSVALFKKTWMDSLPETLRSRVDLTAIPGRYILSEGGRMIQFRDYALDLEAGVDGTGAAESKSALGTKRKWHEKFRPTKKS